MCFNRGSALSNLRPKPPPPRSCSERKCPRLTFLKTWRPRSFVVVTLILLWLQPTFVPAASLATYQLSHLHRNSRIRHAFLHKIAEKYADGFKSVAIVTFHLPCSLRCSGPLRYFSVKISENLCDDFHRNSSNIASIGRIAIQSFCSPLCEYSEKESDMLSFIRLLKSMLMVSNAVAIVTFPPSMLSPSSSTRLQHMADTLLSIKAIPDGDKDLEKLLTGYKDINGFLNVHKVARINTQVPVILEAKTFSMSLKKRRFLALECLNQAPVDGSSGTSYGTSGSCSGSSSKSGALDF
ncbi:hypothetical protein Bca52824_025637 [Brassica carinata]|uniref:Elongator complex protein 4 n=1 Tax=Brassica carinata TaxID=52824 RepID=A0A8X7SKC3_BRACI|nr:hypothetical protein Bca52824_025637 [Brassica carinata]